MSEHQDEMNLSDHPSEQHVRCTDTKSAANVTVMSRNHHLFKVAKLSGSLVYQSMMLEAATLLVYRESMISVPNICAVCDFLVGKMELR